MLALLKTDLADGPDWPGETIFVLEPAHGLSKQDTDQLTARGRLIEFLDPAHSRIDQLRSVLLTASARHWLDKHAVLVLLCDPADVDTASLLENATQNPTLIEHGSATGGDWFVFGGDVVGHPNFVTFFRNMQTGMDDIHIEPTLDIMREHLT